MLVWIYIYYLHFYKIMCTKYVYYVLCVKHDAP